MIIINTIIHSLLNPLDYWSVRISLSAAPTEQQIVPQWGQQLPRGAGSGPKKVWLRPGVKCSTEICLHFLHFWPFLMGHPNKRGASPKIDYHNPLMIEMI